MKKTARKVMEFSDLYDALMTLELCEVSARLDKRDANHALFFCCRRIQRKYAGKRARTMIASVMGTEQSTMRLRAFREAFDAAVSGSVDDKV